MPDPVTVTFSPFTRLVSGFTTNCEELASVVARPPAGAGAAAGSGTMLGTDRAGRCGTVADWPTAGEAEPCPDTGGALVAHAGDDRNTAPAPNTPTTTAAAPARLNALRQIGTDSPLPPWLSRYQGNLPGGEDLRRHPGRPPLIRLPPPPT